MPNTITVQFNLLGPYLTKKQLNALLVPKNKNHKDNFIKDLLKTFFGFPLDSIPKEILERYIEITTKDLHLNIFPYTKNINERLVGPLVSAKKNYCFGDYNASIALSGIVGEMLTVLLWKINDVGIKGNLITIKDEECLFGRSYERLEQERRLKILKTLQLITQEQYDNFCNLKKYRNNYLHLWEINSNDSQKDALSAYKFAFKLFANITGIGLRDARTVKINPKLKKIFNNQ